MLAAKPLVAMVAWLMLAVVAPVWCCCAGQQAQAATAAAEAHHCCDDAGRKSPAKPASPHQHGEPCSPSDQGNSCPKMANASHLSLTTHTAKLLPGFDALAALHFALAEPWPATPMEILFLRRTDTGPPALQWAPSLLTLHTQLTI